MEKATKSPIKEIPASRRRILSRTLKFCYALLVVVVLIFTTSMIASFLMFRFPFLSLCLFLFACAVLIVMITVTQDISPTPIGWLIVIAVVAVLFMVHIIPTLTQANFTLYALEYPLGCKNIPYSKQDLIPTELWWLNCHTYLITQYILVGLYSVLIVLYIAAIFLGSVTLHAVREWYKLGRDQRKQSNLVTNPPTKKNPLTLSKVNCSLDDVIKEYTDETVSQATVKSPRSTEV